jgi:poly-gamma-glutamate synthesis protein (capsule biosynthesis protein)
MTTAAPFSATMMVTGELMLCMPDPMEAFFQPAKPVLHTADVLFSHLEVMHTRRPTPAWESRLPAPDPDHLSCLQEANYQVVSLAGNPAYGYGPAGIEDTSAWLHEHGIETVGAGMNIDEARLPAIIERNGVKFGFLAFDCIGVKANAASKSKAGTAYVDILTHFEQVRWPGEPPAIYTWAEPWSLQAMGEDIARLRAQCDVLTVALHMGLRRELTGLADYETQVAHAAIDAGADVIVGYHAHAIKGIAFYKDKPIFHCMGNMVTAYPWESHRRFRQAEPDTLTLSRIREHAGEGRAQIDPDYPSYPFAAHARNAMIAKFDIRDRQVASIRLIPCLINKQGQPEVHGRDDGGEQVLEHVRMVTEGAKLNAKFEWSGDEIEVGT